MDNSSINGRFKQATRLPPAQRGLVAQGAAARKYSQQIISDKDKSRVQETIQRILERGGVPTRQASRIATNWRGAIEVKRATNETLALIRITRPALAAHRAAIQGLIDAKMVQWLDMDAGDEKEDLFTEIDALNDDFLELGDSLEALDEAIPLHQANIDVASKAIVAADEAIARARPKLER